jgi:hypothetical protein
VLIAKEFVQGLELVEAENSVVIEIRCLENILYVLKFLGLQLVRRLDHEFREVVQLNCLIIGVQMEVLLRVDLLDCHLLLFDLGKNRVRYSKLSVW